MAVRVAVTMSLAGFLVAGNEPADAGPLEVSQARAPLPAREVERSPVLPIGWTELSVEGRRKVATDGFDGRGGRMPLGGELVDSSLTLSVRHGLTSHIEVFAALPARRLAQLGAVGAGVGEAWFGGRALLSGGHWPKPALVLEAVYEAPSGYEPAGEVALGQPAPLGAATPDTRARVLGSHAIGAARATVSIGYLWRLPGRVAFDVGQGADGRIDPGDGPFASGELGLQAGPVYLVGSIGWRAQESFVAAGVPVAGSDGWYVDTGGDVRVGLSRGLAVHLGVDGLLRGEDVQLAPLEDVHPTSGLGWSAGITGRL